MGLYKRGGRIASFGGTGKTCNWTIRGFGRRVVLGLGTFGLVLGSGVSAAVASSPPLGTVTAVRTMQLNATLSAVATAKQVKYVSSNPSGNSIVVSGAVLTPKREYRQAHPANANKIVAWAHGTEGLADQCAPSNNANLDADPAYNYYADTVASYLMQGWTVAASDYPGLGTTGVHPYLVGQSEGRAVIDSVRAVRFLNSHLSNEWVVSGHSQGGQAALFTNELADSYGTGLSLKGAVAVAPASNLDLLASFIPGTPGNGFAVMAVYGFAALDPTVHPEEILAEPALAQADVLRTGCFNEILGAYYSFTPEQLLVGGQVSEDMLAKFAANNPAQQANSAPLFLVQGDADQTIPKDVTDLLQYEECSINTLPVQYTVYPGQDHDPTLYASSDDVINYITARFNNEPAPSNCE